MSQPEFNEAVMRRVAEAVLDGNEAEFNRAWAELLRPYAEAWQAKARPLIALACQTERLEGASEERRAILALLEAARKRAEADEDGMDAEGNASSALAEVMDAIRARGQP